MKQTKYTVKVTTQFRKDYKQAMKRGLNIALLDQVIEKLALGIPLTEKIGIMPYPVFGRDIENVIFNRTGCSSIEKKPRFWY